MLAPNLLVNGCMRELTFFAPESQNVTRPLEVAIEEVVPCMIRKTDPVGRCDYFNQRWLDYRGRSLQQEIGDGWLEGVHPKDRAGLQTALRTPVSDTKSFQIEYRLQRHDGIHHWVLEKASAWFRPLGVFRGYVGCCIDLHERKVMERGLRRRNRALNEFAHVVSHDLKEPLRTIGTYTEMLTRGYSAVSEGQHEPGSGEIIHVILQNVGRAESLIRDLLSYSQATDRAPLEIVSTDSNILLDQAMLACRACIEETRGIVTRGFLPTVHANPVQLGRVLQNLVENGINYRRPGHIPHIHVSAARDYGEWVFQVADNGLGFDPRFSKTIFQPFNRLHSQSGHRGSGIGLAICARVIKRHGGRIWAHSQPGKGSSFFFTLPRPYAR